MILWLREKFQPGNAPDHDRPAQSREDTAFHAAPGPAQVNIVRAHVRAGFRIVRGGMFGRSRLQALVQVDLPLVGTAVEQVHVAKNPYTNALAGWSQTSWGEPTCSMRARFMSTTRFIQQQHFGLDRQRAGERDPPIKLKPTALLFAHTRPE